MIASALLLLGSAAGVGAAGRCFFGFNAGVGAARVASAGDVEMTVNDEESNSVRLSSKVHQRQWHA
jgi:hypothetical protein